LAIEEGAKAVDRIVPELREVLRTFSGRPAAYNGLGAAQFG